MNTAAMEDEHHSMAELYEHRFELFLALCRTMQWGCELQWTMISNDMAGTEPDNPVWRSKIHSDDSVYEGWFIMGMGEEPGRQITYHLPLSRWDDAAFARTLDKAPEWDGHTSNDVLERLKDL